MCEAIHRTQSEVGSCLQSTLLEVDPLVGLVRNVVNGGVDFEVDTKREIPVPVLVLKYGMG